MARTVKRGDAGYGCGFLSAVSGMKPSSSSVTFAVRYDFSIICRDHVMLRAMDHESQVPMMLYQVCLRSRPNVGHRQDDGGNNRMERIS
jgi:hypothetical protein